MGGGRYPSHCKALMISQKYELAANKSMLKILDFAVIFKMNYLNFWNRIQGTINCAILESGIGGSGDPKKTLPKALRTQALTALTSNFGLVGLVQYAW